MTSPQRGWALCASLALAACRCGGSPAFDCPPPAPSFERPGPDPLRTFRPGTGGGGAFGQWVVGPFGLPELAYTLAQESDPRAHWPNTEKRERRDHWHLVGNARVNALASNEGYVEVYLEDRGAEALNRFDARSHNFGGGFSIVDDGAGPWTSLYAYRPKDALTSRQLGLGYARYATCRPSLIVTHQISAPSGDRPFVVDEVLLQNRTREPRKLTHLEVWDPNRHYLKPQLVHSGAADPAMPAELDAARAELNEVFRTSATADATSARVRNRLADPGPDPALPGDVDSYPLDTFLVDLDGAGSRFVTDGKTLWGSGDPAHPSRLDAGMLAAGPAKGQPAVLAALRTLTLPAAGQVTLRYAFGGVAQDAPLPDLSRSSLAESTASLRETLPYFDGGGEDVKREFAWHAGQLGALAGWQEYFEHRTINQGSAYLWLHGLDGAVRDYVFSAAAATYLDPALSRETLLFSARMRLADTGGLVYSVAGHGNVNGAVVHQKPSDLDLHWLWGLAEYVLATGDTAILDSPEPFWPREGSPRPPVAEHARLALRYLVDRVGVGPHGLVSLGDGDWDDGITFMAQNRDQAISGGESHANAALAALALPLAAAILDGRDDATAAEMRAVAAAQRTALAGEWNGRWYPRAWFAPGERFGDDVLYAIQNGLALAAEVPTPEQAQTLVAALKENLEDRSTTGMNQFHWVAKPPPWISDPEGNPDEGMTNPAITSLAIWGYAHWDPDRAWDALLHTLMARKADAYPDLWYGIWSGPDALYTSANALAGQTWSGVTTAMTDMPLPNSNQHAGPLLGLWRVAGIEPKVATRDGKPKGCLALEPRTLLSSGEGFTLDAPLLRLEVRPGLVRGEYRPVVDGEITLCFASPPGSSAIASGSFGGALVPAGGEVAVTLPISKGVPIPFEIHGN
jgi:hypothetical protein